MLAQAQMVLPENFSEEARSAAAASLLLSYKSHLKDMSTAVFSWVFPVDGVGSRGY